MSKNLNFLKKYLTVLFSLCFTFTNAQIYYVKETNNLNYVGIMNDEIMSYLDGEEILMYFECLKMIKEDTNTVNWLEDKYFHELFNGKNEYSFEIATRKNYNDGSFYLESKDKYEFILPKPMCLVFIIRNFGKFNISVKKYY